MAPLMWGLAVAAAAALAFAPGSASQPPCDASAGGRSECQAGGEANSEDDVALLQMRGRRDVPASGRDMYDVKGKSVYILMPDRFNHIGDTTACNGDVWCGGTFKGIQEQLPYIKGMGFDCIWITPVVENVNVPDRKNSTCGSGIGWHGYWAQNYYKTEPHFGTLHEFKALVKAAHREGLCVMLDIVMNHMGPIHPEEGLTVEKKIPFDKPEYYHQVGRGSQTWDEYTAKYCNWPNPFQSMGPGAQCKLDMKDGVPDYTNGGNYCNNYHPANGPYNAENYLGKDAAGPPNLKYCGAGNYDCPGYNLESQWLGWFYDLGDLNHSNPEVVEKQLDWIRMVRDDWGVDSIRLDTTPYMPWEFLAQLQEAAHPMQIHGEVTTTNISFHASFQEFRSGHENYKTLAGLENFPPFYKATPGYCGDDGQPSSPVAMWDLRELGKTMSEQLSAPYTNVQSLMNFGDNQDYAPLANTCKKDVSRIKNMLTWVFFCFGMPTVTWGTEQGNTVNRESLWQYGWDTTTWQYQFIKTLNKVRKSTAVSMMRTKVVHSTRETLVFKRYRFLKQVWIFTTSKTGDRPVTYDKAPMPCPSKCWVDALTGEKAKIMDGKVVASSTAPLVLVLGKC